MTLIQRRILTAFLGLLLLVVSPLIILYSAGFRYNFKKFRVEKVGLLYVTTKPNDTKISVNNQEYTVGNELVLRSLPAGEHEITLFADGYNNWSKKLEISKGQSTFITDQVLFLDEEEQPFELFTNGLNHVFSADDIHFFQSTNFLFMYDFEDKSILEIELESDSVVTSGTLSSNQDRFVFQQDSNWFELSVSDQVIQKLAPVDMNFAKHLNNHLFGITDLGLVDLHTPDAAMYLTQPNIQDILSADQGFWFLASDQAKQHTFLYKVYDIDATPQLIDQFPYAEAFTIAEDNKGFLTIHDADNTILYLVDTSTTVPTTKALFNVRYWQWNQDKSSLLTSTEFELTIHHVDNGITQELLTRLSTPIGQVAWYEDESHVFYTKYNSLYLIERDGRDRRNEYELSDISDDFLILGSDAEQIEYFSSTDTTSLFLRRFLTE